MTKLKLKVWIAILNFIVEHHLKENNVENYKYTKSVLGEVEQKLLEEYRREN